MAGYRDDRPSLRDAPPPRTSIDATYTVGTGSSGTHLYYRHPPIGPELRNTTGERGGLGWKVDTRAHGGYVVAAGSTVAGRPYAVALDVERHQRTTRQPDEPSGVLLDLDAARARRTARKEKPVA